MNERFSIQHLREESAHFGASPYLLTQGEDGRPHAVLVSVEWQEGRMFTRAGAKSTANIAARPLLSLLWPPVEEGGYSLIINGDGYVIGSGPEAQIGITPTHGVLHRPGTSADSEARGCCSDCIPLFG